MNELPEILFLQSYWLSVCVCVFFGRGPTNLKNMLLMGRDSTYGITNAVCKIQHLDFVNKPCQQNYKL